MELFVVNDASGKKIEGNFGNKQAAKVARDRLQAQHNGGLPKPEERQDPAKWAYRIGYGKNHVRMAPMAV